MNLNDYLSQLKKQPESITFEDTISTIDENYDFTPGRFTNGEINNNANENNGSCKIFFFAKMHSLSENDTLHCFGNYYRKDVLENPDATDHQNIRNFMRTGWSGINFDTNILNLK